MKRDREWLEAVKKRLLKKDSLLICVLSGVLLMVILWPVPEGEDGGQTLLGNPGGTGASAEPETETFSQDEGWQEEEAALALEKRLEEILSAMEGVGKAEVMVTLESSREKVVEKDAPTGRSSVQEEDSAGGSRTTQEVEVGESTVYSQSGDGGQLPYVVKELSPQVEGVSVVCQGGGDALVQKNITEVIQALFGIDVHKIKVVKMKQEG